MGPSHTMVQSGQYKNNNKKNKNKKSWWKRQEGVKLLILASLPGLYIYLDPEKSFSCEGWGGCFSNILARGQSHFLMDTKALY